MMADSGLYNGHFSVHHDRHESFMINSGLERHIAFEKLAIAK
jgi:hypothetical protein